MKQLTRYPIPFGVDLTVMILAEPEVWDHRDADYDTVLRSFNEIGYSIDPNNPSAGFKKTYGGGTLYPRNVLAKFLDDMKRFNSDTQYLYDEDGTLFRSTLCEVSLWPNYKPYGQVFRARTDFDHAIFYSLITLKQPLLPFFMSSWAIEEFTIDFQNVAIEPYSGGVSPVYYRDYHTSLIQQAGRLIGGPHDSASSMIRTIGRNHPAMVLSGISLVQTIISRYFFDRPEPPRIGIIPENYSVITELDRIFLDQPMVKPIINSDKTYIFKEDREIPGIELEAIDEEQTKGTMKEILDQILKQYTRNTGSYRDRCAALVKSFFIQKNFDHVPFFNRWSFADLLHPLPFHWEYGPEVS